MSAPAFTPGPWNATPKGVYGCGYRVARMTGPSDKDAANARLIAAAPSMYRQLEIFVSTIVNDDLLAMDPELASEVETTIALLREARGEQ